MSTIFSGMKLKDGELLALEQIERKTSNGVTPIFDVLRPTKANPVAKRIEDSARLLIESGWCKPSKKFIVDTYDIPIEDFLPDGSTPIEGLAKKLSYYNFQPGYCYGFDRGIAYEEGFSRLIQSNLIENIYFRLGIHDLIFIQDTLAKIQSVLSLSTRKFKNVGVIFDLRVLEQCPTDSDRICTNASHHLKVFGINNQIFLASAMWDWTKIKPEEITRVPRSDYLLWESLLKRNVQIKYGDYGVISPQFTEPDKTIIASPKIRYCGFSSWLVSKGEKPQKGGNSQYPRLAKRLIKEKEFRHNELNWGHDQLKDMSDYRLDTVGHSKSVAIDTCNHLDLVFQQVTYAERIHAESQSAGANSFYDLENIGAPKKLI
ncbi:beta family protein [Acidovorax sp. LjRoot194]|uniref:beta family protein n=1 Tax=Acidovorax sp. LjRoot194 TaxID=3342280 RepID=UPI003ECE1E6A